MKIGMLAALLFLAISQASIFMPLAFADQASAHYHQALAYKREGKLDLAEKELKAALEIRQNYAAAHLSLGIIYRQQKNFDQAITHLEKAAALEPRSGQTHYSLGICYSQAGRPEEALKSLMTAAALSPKDDQIQAAVGTKLIRKDPKQAIPYLQAAVNAKPNDPSYLHHLGLAYRKSNNNKMAEQYLLKSASLKEDAATEFDLGALYRHMEKPDKALEHYEAAIRLDPKQAAPYWDAAHMYMLLKRDEDAITAFQNYLKIKGEAAPDAEIARKRIKELKEGNAKERGKKESKKVKKGKK